ncbi:MAG: hypothetical protein ACHQYP_04565 [Nitrospiria bacterium]
MKLKSILIMAMVTTLTMAGGAFAATSTVTTSANTDAGGTQFGHAITIFGCTAVVGAATACAPMSAGNALTFVNQTTGGSGVGLVGGMPAQVAYSSAAGQYLPSTADATTGYLLNSNLYGMCGVGGCPLFVPYAGVSSAVGFTAKLLSAEGGDPVAGTIPVGVSEFALQGTFTTGLISGFSDTAAGGSGMINELSQVHFHTFAAGAGDYFDQRLANTVVGANTITAGSPSVVMNQGFGYGGGSTAITVETGAVDPTWLGNVDPFTISPYNCNNVGIVSGPCTPYANSGVVSQQIGDNMGGNINGVDIGSYGQIFNNDLQSVLDPTYLPSQPNAPQGAYVPATGPVIPATLP